MGTYKAVKMKRQLNCDSSVLLRVPFFFPPSLLLSSSTRRRLYPRRPSGQGMVTGRCRPFSPAVRAFNFCRAYGSVSPLLVDFHRMLLTHDLALSANQFLCRRKSLRVWALGENWTREIGFSRHEDILPSHRGLGWKYTNYLYERPKTTPTWIIVIHHTNTRKVNQGNLHHDWLLCNLQHDLQ